MRAAYAAQIRATEQLIDLAGLSLPVDLPVSLPSDLVRQRPDILSAEAQLHVASANIGVSTAAMFPSFSLSGAYGAAGSSLGNLSAANGRFWSIGPSFPTPEGASGFRDPPMAQQRVTPHSAGKGPGVVL
ncbi:MAG TPA: TolC family protein [Opitutaceae bacterium]|nr:TolC family protein [Opitutaceae bacterium]